MGDLCVAVEHGSGAGKDEARSNPTMSGLAHRQRPWAEAVTRLEGQQVPDAVYDMARQQWSEAELTQLTLAIVAINGWNRCNVAFHTPAGNYGSVTVCKTG
jgi:hypothetical protein